MKKAGVQSMIKNYKLKDIEDVVFDMDELMDTEGFVVVIDDDLHIVVSGWSVYVPSLNLTLREGLACVLDEKTKSYQPDFDVVLIYDGDPSSQDILYYEQDAMITTLNNWLHSKFSFTELQNLDCELYIPEETEEI